MYLRRKWFKSIPNEGVKWRCTRSTEREREREISRDISDNVHMRTYVNGWTFSKKNLDYTKITSINYCYVFL